MVVVFLAKPKGVPHLLNISYCYLRASLKRRRKIGLALYVSLLATGCTGSPAFEKVRESTVEEARIPLALIALPVPLAQTQQRAAANSNAIALATNLAAVQTVGRQLWQQAVTQNQQGLVDDRPLYWQRLASKQQFRNACRPSTCNTKLAAFELSSRGIQNIRFTKANALRVLVTGFDPFALDRDVTQTNPSGVLALQLDNQLLTNQDTGQTAHIQSVIFPVRFADFDAGLVEQVLTPLLESAGVDVVITLSMGRDGFDLERFPGKRRATTATDNLDRQTGASATNPLVPLLDGKPIDGPEFVEFLLPARALTQIQSPYPVTDNRQVRTLQDGEVTATSLKSLAGTIAVAGSGGTYLSNEISYRSIALSQRLDVALPIGHIHLPRLTGYNKTTLLSISSQLQAMLRQAIPALTLDSNNPNLASPD